jgi:hypothetical protein
MSVQTGLAVDLRTAVMSRKRMVCSSDNYLRTKADGEGPGNQGGSEVSTSDVRNRRCKSKPTSTWEKVRPTRAAQHSEIGRVS